MTIGSAKFNTRLHNNIILWDQNNNVRGTFYLLKSIMAYCINNKVVLYLRINIMYPLHAVIEARQKLVGGPLFGYYFFLDVLEIGFRELSILYIIVTFNIQSRRNFFFVHYCCIWIMNNDLYNNIPDHTQSLWFWFSNYPQFYVFFFFFYSVGLIVSGNRLFVVDQMRNFYQFGITIEKFNIIY